MKITADLHLHSPHSRATSKNITMNNLEKYAGMKGINLLGTGDFTHPKWLEILKGSLEEDGSGILKSKSGFNFLLSTEISNIYGQNGKTRRIHNLILAPDFETVEQIRSWLSTKGRLDYDGRPIFGFSCPELVENLRGISERIMTIPAHVWTPWFSVFGSKSGFDSVGECYQDQSRHIHALETGLSSDPPMNWRISALDEYSLVSFSDSHSMWPWRIGREATMFGLKELNYDGITNAIRTGDGLRGTLEFFPEKGKYHYDGHRNCGVSMNPVEAEKNRNICPVCGKPLTLGVLHRVEELADRPEGSRPDGTKEFHRLIPLSEILARAMGSSVNSRRVWEEYGKLTRAFGSELGVLMEAGLKEMKEMTSERIAGLIMRIRNGDVRIKAGSDGVYGEIKDIDSENIGSQKTLGQFRSD